jgi:hypothetical protein
VELTVHVLNVVMIKNPLLLYQREIQELAVNAKEATVLRIIVNAIVVVKNVLSNVVVCNAITY